MIPMKIRRKPLAVLAATVLLSLSACSAYTDAPAASGDPGSAKLQVAVAFYPFEFVVDRVGGDQVAVENLTAPGAEPHDLELTPQQVASLSTVDLVVYQSGFQPAVDTAVQQAQPKQTIDTASFLTMMKASQDGADTGSSTSAEDPHTWLDPTNLAAIAEHVRDALSETDPSHAEAFAANATALVADLTALDQEFTDGLAQCQRTTFITSHAAFGYLAHRYHLEQVGIRGLEPDVEPTAARIAEVQQIARDEGVTTIFFETLVSPVVAESIARDLGLATDVLDPLEGLTDESRGNDYLEVMRANLSALRTANSCS